MLCRRRACQRRHHVGGRRGRITIAGGNGSPPQTHTPCRGWPLILPGRSCGRTAGVTRAMCFFLSLLLLGPRFVLFIWWLVNPVMWNAVFDTYLLPVLGIVFLPWTTLMFVFLGPGGITGFEWV